METWYQLQEYGSPEITEIEVEKSTDKSVWVAGRCIRKNSRFVNIFKTRKECVDYYAGSKEKEIASARETLNYRIEAFAKGMKKLEE